jgi:3-methyladenine DNA glycosylase AlkC
MSAQPPSTGAEAGSTASPSAFKHKIHPDAVRALMERLEAALTARFLPFSAREATALATHGLDALELKARVAQVADAVHASLPPGLDAAGARAVGAALVEAAGPALPDENGLTDAFVVWPLLSVVERHGLDQPEASLEALSELTRRFSAEFAVRPFLVQHPALAWAAARAWAADPDLHRRRLASEGTRPRLPWGMQLRASIADPSAGLALISTLIDDPSPYVRRSVANHLNDVSKDHPERAVQTAAAWLASGRTEGPREIVGHALRGLRKAGHPGALGLLGLSADGLRCSGWKVLHNDVQIGDFVEFEVELHNSGAAAVALSLDLALGWPAKRGGWSRKQLHWTKLGLDPGERRTLSGRQRLKVVSTRRVEPGPHRLALVVNGKELDHAMFQLVSAEA